MKKLGLLCSVLLVISFNTAFGTSPYVMSTGDYSENFSTIATWAANFASPSNATYWSSVDINASGTIPDGIKTTTSTATFSTGTTTGVQLGTQNLVFLTTGGTNNTAAIAVDLSLDFTGRTAGTMAFNYTEINNGTGNRVASLYLYTSTDGGASWSGFLNWNANNNSNSSGIQYGMPLPSGFDGNSNARIRFYEFNGAGGSTGSTRPKISIDDIVVTSFPYYTWIGGISGDWTIPTNWYPTRSTPETNDVLIFDCGGPVTATNIPAETIGQLHVSGNTTVSLGGGPITLTTGILRLISGTIALGSNNLNVSGSISGGSSSSYVVTNGAGGLIQPGGTSFGDVTFPVGTNTYSPLVLSDYLGSEDDIFTVSVKNSFDYAPYSPEVVNKQWKIAEAVPGGSHAIITLQWNTVDETGTYNGFVRTNDVYIGRYNGPLWEQTLASYTDLGGGVYTASAGSFTQFSLFGVGNNNALPVELSSFTTNVNGRNVQLSWETKTEKNSDKFDIEKMNSAIGSSWINVGSVKAAVLSNSPKEYSFTDKNLQSGKYQYRLKMIDNDGSFAYSSVEAAEVAIPKDFAVSQNYPNPFNPSTKIDYQIPVDSKVIMEVYNIAGQKVSDLVNKEQSAGYYSVDFGASKLSSGVYIYRIVASDKASGNNFSSIKKMMLLK